jgi:hypothetical protein
MLAGTVIQTGARRQQGEPPETVPDRRAWFGRLAWGALVGVALLFGVSGFVLSRDAGRQAQAATVTANEQIAAARQEAAQQIAEARDAALKAQTVSDVLAAPDLLRLNLVGRNRLTTAQVLLSRTRGLVISGSRIPPPPAGSTYQVWLLTPEEPVSAGVITPDATGRVTVVTDMPPRVPPPIGGASITIEPAGGSQFPTGPAVLSRPQN